MRRRSVWLGLLCGALVAGGVSANSISGSGLGAGWGLDWGTYDPFHPTPGNNGNVEFLYNTVSLNNSSYRSAPGILDMDPPGSDVTTPGAGGQNYDAEAIFYAFSGDLSGGYLSIGMFTGFNPNGENSGIGSPSTFLAGDIFIDLGNDSDFDIAIAMGAGEARSGSAWAYLNSSSEIDPYYGTTDPSPNHGIAGPYRLDESTADVFGFNASDVRTAHTLVWDDAPDRQRWFYEARLYLDGGSFDLASLLGVGGGVGLHWTMECGNDYIHVTDNTPLTPVVPVPAAAPMILMGMGAVAFVRRARRVQA